MEVERYFRTPLEVFFFPGPTFLHRPRRLYLSFFDL